MKFFLILLPFLFLTLACDDPGFEDITPLEETETTDVTPASPIHHMLVESIEILEIAPLSPEGNVWDIDRAPFSPQFRSGPDLSVRFKSFVDGFLVSSDTLDNHANGASDYTILSNPSNCFSPLSGAVMDQRESPLLIPVNFNGALEIVDVEYWGFPNNPGLLPTLMQSFQFLPVDYVEDTPGVIVLTSEGQCRYTLKIYVRWIQ